MCKALCRALKPLSETLMLRIESGDDNTTGDRFESTLLVASGANLFGLISSSVTLAARLSGEAKPLAEKQLPRSLDFFGWCTWDAFYSTVSAKVRLRLGLLRGSVLGSACWVEVSRAPTSHTVTGCSQQPRPRFSHRPRSVLTKECSPGNRWTPKHSTVVPVMLGKPLLNNVLAFDHVLLQK